MDEEISQEDTWAVTDVFFKENSFVKHQIASFDEFMHTIQKTVDKFSEFEIRPEYRRPDSIEDIYIKFGQTYLVELWPSHPDINGDRLCPKIARLRSMTYSANLLVDVTQRIRKGGHDGVRVTETQELRKVLIGKVPIMVRSRYCVSYQKSVKDLAALGECPYDHGGYFIVNGTEKVLIAQESISPNHVYVHSTVQPNKYAYVAEVRSLAESQNSPPSIMHVRMLSRASIKQRKKRVGFFGPTKASAKKGSLGQFIRATLPFIRTEIPIFIVFRALGYVADKDILERICYDLSDTDMTELLRPSLEEAFPIQNQQVALEFIGKRGLQNCETSEKRIQYAREILQNKMLPHVGIGEHCETQKAYYFGYIIHQLLCCSLGRRREDDSDHLGNKRLDLTGPLLGGLFQNLFQKFTRDVRRSVQKNVNKGEIVNLNNIIKKNDGTITNGLNYSLSTGNAAGRRGVSQLPLNRLTYISTLSHLRRFNSPVEHDGKSGKRANHRHVHSSHWGLACPTETSTGQECGLIKNLPLTTHITVGSEAAPILEFLKEWPIDNLGDISPAVISQSTKVFVNGCWVGIHSSPEKMVNTLRQLRRMQSARAYGMGDCTPPPPPHFIVRIILDHSVLLHSAFSLFYSPNKNGFDIFEDAVTTELGIVRDIHSQELRLYTDYGRCSRPLFIVEKQRLLIKKKDIRALQTRESQDDKGVWHGLMEKGVIEYIDAKEEETTMISMTIDDLVSARQDPFASPSYTHCEIHPSLILGVCASLIPLINHNQATRNTFQSSMSKQSLGIYATSYETRMDNFANILYYPQKPLVTTRAMEYLHFMDLPAGNNAIVAVMSYGYNQEDSIIMNESSIDRGFLRSSLFRSYSDTENKMDNLSKLSWQSFGRPSRKNTMGMKPSSYDHLDDDGFPLLGTPILDEGVIIGKTGPIIYDESEGQSSRSRYTQRDLSTSICKRGSGRVDQVAFSTNDAGLRSVKVKIRSVRIPQVGDKFSSLHGQKGVIGMVYTQEDLPWTIEGITPDIIINPHSIPSRMTIGQLIECIIGKATASKGMERDATPFTGVTVENITKALHKCGYHEKGLETMYSGHTGRRINNMIFLGPNYYQRLKQMVDDKIHSRARGPMQMLTRQPTEGRSRDGGMRFGEMERDCLIGHGAALNLKERLFVVSDPYRAHFCRTCGLIATANLGDSSLQCLPCKSNTNIVQVHFPYGCKLLFQELMAMCIAPRIKVGDIHQQV